MMTFKLAFLTLLLFCVNYSYAQPPEKNGFGGSALNPMDEYEDNKDSCKGSASSFNRQLTGKCTSTKLSFWGQARFPQLSYIANSGSKIMKGGNLKSAREISNIIFDQKRPTSNAHGLNLLFVFFAQFVDHNFAATPEKKGSHANIPVPKSDPVLKFKSLNFERSMRAKLQDNTTERPINTLPSSLDLVAVYGPDRKRNEMLVEKNDLDGELTGKLLYTKGGNLLPNNFKGALNAPDNSGKFFLAGDHRANENPMLVAFHTLFMREHNRLADLIRQKLGNIPGEDIYDRARSMNIAQFQKIVYEEFFPAITGKFLPAYEKFDSSINPTLSDIFAGAAFRIGHTMVSEKMPRYGPNGFLRSLDLMDLFFNEVKSFHNFKMESMIRGTAKSFAEEVDTKVVDVLRNGLFDNVKGANGFDLIAINIQRGRDHALPTYNEIRAEFNLPKVSRFSQITYDRDVQRKLSRAYSNRVNDVEAFVGLLAEDNVPGTGYGRTMGLIWEREFLRLRDGDQFFYLNEDKYHRMIKDNFKSWIEDMKTPGAFTLRDIITKNTRIRADQLPKNIFNLKLTSTPRPPARRQPSPNAPNAPNVPPTPTESFRERLFRTSKCDEDDNVCCAKSCESCGGSKCYQFNGGVKECCREIIKLGGHVCNENKMSGCIIKPTPSPVCHSNSKPICCAGTCGECGGKGCGKREGGQQLCCHHFILENNYKCGSEVIPGVFRNYGCLTE